MTVSSILTDEATGRTAKISIDNALAVTPSNPSVPFNAELAVDDVPVNIVPAKGNNIFCMTGIILTGNKSIDPNIDATVEIYTANSATSTVAISTLMNLPIARSAQTVLTGILIEAEKGRFINGKTSDDDVFVTVLGFYLDLGER